MAFLYAQFLALKFSLARGILHVSCRRTLDSEKKVLRFEATGKAEARSEMRVSCPGDLQRNLAFEPSQTLSQTPGHQDGAFLRQPHPGLKPQTSGTGVCGMGLSGPNPGSLSSP